MYRRFQKDPLKYALELATFSIICNFVLLFFVVLTWNSYGKISEDNHISVGLTTIEIFLIVVALCGFWMLRPVVTDAACKISEEVAREVAREKVDLMRPEIKREIAKFVQAELAELYNSRHENASSSEGYDIARAMAEENGGDDD